MKIFSSDTANLSANTENAVEKMESIFLESGAIALLIFGEQSFNFL